MMRDRFYQSIKLIVYFVLITHIILPLLSLLTQISSEDISRVVYSNQFLPMLKNSLVSTTIATIVSIVLALSLAWCINRTNIKHKGTISILFTLPMLIPSISHGMGLTILFGDNGIFTNLTGINIHLFGLTGIVIGATLYAFPAAFLMFADIFRYEDYTVYEVAKVLGLTKFQQFVKITLPNLRKPLISAIFAVFTMIFTDYGVPLVVGGKYATLPVYMYREVIGLMDYSKGAVLAIALLVPAVVAFIIDLLNKEEGSSTTVIKPFVISKNKKRDVLANIYCSTILFLIAVPIVNFLILCFVNQYPVDFSFTLNNIHQSFELGLKGYLLNSLLIALSTSLFGTIISYVTAYITARSNKEFSAVVLHFISLISLSIPGIVLGLSYVLFFKSSFVYGTYIILISVNIIHFFGSPYLMAYNALLKFNGHLEDVATALGISKIKMLKDVYVPSTSDTILEMFAYNFVNSMVTISAISFLANFKNMPIALLIPQFDSQSLIGPIAFISIIILVINIAMKLIVYFLKRHFQAKESY